MDPSRHSPLADVFNIFAGYACYSDNIGLYNDIRIAQYLTSFTLSAIPVVGDLYMLASAYTGQDLVTGARLTPQEKQTMAALSVISLGTMILGGAGIGEQEAAVAVRAETEPGDLLSVGEKAAQGAQDTLRAGADETHAADAVASEAGAAGASEDAASGSSTATKDRPADYRGLGPSERLSNNLRTEDFRLSQDTCFYCSRKVKPWGRWRMSSVTEHVYPNKRAASVITTQDRWNEYLRDSDNLVVACKSCNNAKGDRRFGRWQPVGAPFREGAVGEGIAIWNTIADRYGLPR